MLQKKTAQSLLYRLNREISRWIVLPEDNPDLRNENKKGIGGIANPFHAYIEKDNGYILYGNDGSIRFFENNLLKKWVDYKNNALIFSYSEGRLIRIEGPKNNYLGFHYNYEGKISEAYARDGRRIYYHYDSRGDLIAVIQPNDAAINYEYNLLHQIIRETRPLGSILENEYENNKVIKQRSPLGPQQEMITSATFAYHDGVTVATDASGSNTEYHIYQKQIYKIIDPLGHLILRSWFIDKNTWFDADTETIQSWDQAGGWQRSLKSSKDKRGLITEYTYDDRGNLQEVQLIGNDLTGDGVSKISKLLTYNSRNLCTSETAFNRITNTTYDPNFPYLPKRIEIQSENIILSFVDLEYSATGQVRSENRNGALTIFEYEEHGFPSKSIQTTGTEDPDVIITYKYNHQGQCIEKTTSDSIQINDYDIVGNVLSSITYNLNGVPISKRYLSYNQNNECVCSLGDDPNDIQYFDYNSAGLLKARRKKLSHLEGSSDGVAYTLYEYDTCG